MLPTDPVQLALHQAEEGLANLRRIIEVDRRGERPISTKIAAHKYGVCPKTMQRLAARGAGVKIGGHWYVYEALVVMPAERA